MLLMSFKILEVTEAIMKDRCSNIELLRILAILGVVILHYNNPVIGGGLKYVQEGTLNFYLLYILESVFACGVNLFIIISGYFMCTSYKRNIWRLIELLVQVMVFKEILYLIRVLSQSSSFSIKSFITSLIPANYFVILYGVVFILSPFINTMIDRLSEKNFKVLMVSSICMFSIYPTIVDLLGEFRGEPFNGLSTIGLYGSQWGYSVINFILMYLIGAYLRRGQIKIHTIRVRWLILVLTICIFFVVVWARMNDRVGFFTERSAWEYCNPLIILIAVLLFELFSRINIGSIKIINGLAEGVFTVFLLHNVFIPYLQIEKFVNGNAIVMLLHIIVCDILIYVICWCVHRLYHIITDPVFKMLSNKFRNLCLDVENQEKHIE